MNPLNEPKGRSAHIAVNDPPPLPLLPVDHRIASDRPRRPSAARRCVDRHLLGKAEVVFRRAAIDSQTSRQTDFRHGHCPTALPRNGKSAAVEFRADRRIVTATRRESPHVRSCICTTTKATSCYPRVTWHGTTRHRPDLPHATKPAACRWHRHANHKLTRTASDLPAPPAEHHHRQRQRHDLDVLEQALSLHVLEVELDFAVHVRQA